MKALTLSAAVVLGVSLALAANAQTTQPTPSPMPPAPEASPRATQGQERPSVRKMSAADYVQTAARSDMFEIQAAKVAMDKSKSDSVRQFAQMMIDDHTASSVKMKAAIEKANVKANVPKDLDKKHADMLDRLKKTSASNFDQTYLQSQLAAHRDMLNLNKGYSQNGDNDTLKQFAADATTVVEKHLNELQQMAQVKGGTQSQRQAPDRATGGSPVGNNNNMGGASGTRPSGRY
jgi:putative membrane protein